MVMKKHSEYDEYFQDYGAGTPFSWLQYLAQGIAESNLDPDAKSSAGAIGIMQIVPTTAGIDLGLTAEQLYDPELNISGGIRYMCNMHTFWKSFNIPASEMWYFCLASYNAGVGNVSKAYRLARHKNWEHKDWGVVGGLCLPRITGEKNSIETLNYVARCKRLYLELEKEIQINSGVGKAVRSSRAPQANRRLL